MNPSSILIVDDEPDNFDVIDDNGHLGCGFIHPAYLVQLLGSSQPAQRVFAIQVRIIILSDIIPYTV